MLKINVSILDIVDITEITLVCLGNVENELPVLEIVER
jgi:hypothetical protein